MTIFSDKYNELTKNLNIRVYDMANHCSISPSSLYQIFNGRRKPPGKQLVFMIADYLNLTPLQREELIEAYERTVMGTENYDRQKSVENFLKNGRSPAMNETPPFQVFLPAHLPMVLLSDRLQVIQGFESLLSSFRENPSSSLDLFVDPAFPLVSTTLCSKQNPFPYPIRHLAAISGSTDSLLRAQSIMKILGNALPLYLSHLDYEVFTFYENGLPENALFPYFVLSDEMILFISGDFEKGFLSRDKGLVQMGRDHFKKLQDHSSYLVTRTENPKEQIAMYVDSLDDFAEGSQFFHTRICTALYMTPEILRRSLNRDYFTSSKEYEQMLETYGTYARNFQTRVQEEKHPAPIMSMAGVDEFLRTGMDGDYTPGLFHPLSPEDRIEILEKLIASADQQPYRFLRMNSDLTSSQIEVLVSPHRGIILYHTDDGKVGSFRLEHELLIRLFYGFFTGLKDDYFMKKEDILARLSQKLEWYRRETEIEKSAG